MLHGYQHSSSKTVVFFGNRRDIADNGSSLLNYGRTKRCRGDFKSGRITYHRRENRSFTSSMDLSHLLNTLNLYPLGSFLWVAALNFESWEYMSRERGKFVNQ